MERELKVLSTQGPWDAHSLSDDGGQHSLAWRNITITAGRNGKILLHGISGSVDSGEMLAIMGPSGCGKTTLLNHLAFRKTSGLSTQPQSKVFIEGREADRGAIEKKMRYVGSEDVLIGSLTVRETLDFAAQFSMPAETTRAQRKVCVDDLLQTFGLYDQANTIIGTLARKGISTGQKRRLSVAAQMTAAPSILLLDEPTSGLDSAASYNVMSYIRDVVKAHGLTVICSIHQPSSSTFNLFDKLLLLAEGRTCYSGSISDARPYFERLGYKMDPYTNPSEFMLELVNVEVARDKEAIRDHLTMIQGAWAARQAPDNPGIHSLAKTTSSGPNRSRTQASLRKTFAVLHRSWIKSYRDILAYGVRFGMYMGLAIMMGTVWLRLAPEQVNIQAYATCILFGSAFMSFMAVVYVPAFMEDRLVYIKDRENGLYGSVTFMLTNFVIGLPYLFLIAFCTSTFTYWMVNFRPSGDAFMIWVLWMYLNLVAAESLIVFVASLIPNLVGALAAAAMFNGIWMACNGFMVTNLNPFYHYVFYYINYQAYVFRGLLSNEFAYRNYACNDQCYCQYNTPLASQCQISGMGVLEQQYGFDFVNQGLWVGITIGIIGGLRLMGWLVLEFRR